MILTVDVGTSATKVALWDGTGLVALGTTALATRHPDPGRAEQDARTWWPSVVSSCAEVRDAVPDRWGSVQALGCTGARQTVVLADVRGEPLGPALLWSDRRAGEEATGLSDPPASAMASGIVTDGGSVAAKLAWWVTHDVGAWRAARWVLPPRDLVVRQLTGEVLSDDTMASRSGLYDLDGRLVDGLAGSASGRLPPVVAPGTVAGPLTAGAATALGLAPGTPVVVGPADRPAEAVGAGATDRSPLVSWGTTANVSVPLDNRPDRRPHGIVLSRGAVGGWLLEGGLSAAGSLLAWIGGLTGRGPEELAVLAARCPPGARGVTATPWLEGARAPWWQPEARVALAGLDAAHGPGELARAAIEAVAWEVGRCLGAIGAREPVGPDPVGLVLGGGGSALPVWCEVLTGITGLPAIRRRSGQAASAGTAVVTARAVGLDLEVDGFDPVVERHEPDPAAVARYAELRARSDLLAADAMAWAGGPVRPGPPAPGGHRTGEPV